MKDLGISLYQATDINMSIDFWYSRNSLLSLELN